MKFVCLGYGEENAWDAMTKVEQDAFIEECFTYDDTLRDNGQWIDGGQALQSTRTAKTLRWQNGKVVVTDGPVAETKERLGGLGVLEARDIDHAVGLMSKHPGLRFGPLEIRPVDEESRKRKAELLKGESSTTAPVPSADVETKTFATFGYIPERDIGGYSQSQFDTMLKECAAYDEARRKDGQWLAGIALQSVQTAKTLRTRQGKVVVTDGPFAETKEQLGGVVLLRLKDMTQAVELLSKHPCLCIGVSIEIRPIDEDMNARWETRER